MNEWGKNRLKIICLGGEETYVDDKGILLGGRASLTVFFVHLREHLRTPQ